VRTTTGEKPKYIEPSACLLCHRSGYREMVVHAVLHSGPVAEAYAVPCDCPKGLAIARGLAGEDGHARTVHGWAEHYRGQRRVTRVVVDPLTTEDRHGREYAERIGKARPLVGHEPPTDHRRAAAGDTEREPGPFDGLTEDPR
jgi:hypothetical protein